MTTAKVTIDIPASTWEEFVQATVQQQQQPAREVLLWLMQSYIQRNKQTEAEFYSELTRRYLQGALPRTGSINAIQLDSQVVTAIERVARTSDAVELIEQTRSRQ